ncbi:MAG: hypothetical protein WAM14_09155 [Candidatus Nitrosopolaris sp.]
MTTLTQHALAYGEGAQPGDNCYPKFYYPCDNSGGSYSGYAYIQPAKNYTLLDGKLEQLRTIDRRLNGWT